jgi:murein DD-endopeptidase MepM/ murein hydrolase activator NlpD
MRRPPPPPRRRFPVTRLAIAAAGFVVLGAGWKLTSADPAAASAPPPDASVPADYVPEDSAAPLPPPVDPLGSEPDEVLAPPDSSDGPAAPLDNALRVTSNFGMRRHPILGFTRMHQGVDFGAREGAPVLAAEDGVVTTAGWGGGYGNVIRIRHAAGWATGYAHLSRYAPGIAPGVHVTRGEVIGFVGHTGLATGPHLHFEVSLNGVKLDPLTTPFGGAPAARDPHEGAYARLRPALTTDMPG